MTYKLPPLPEPSWPFGSKYNGKDMQAYAIAAIEAQGVPDGWQLVPKEPTPEMLDAGRKACNGNMYPQDMLHGPRSMMADRWFAALASAPPAPLAEQHPDDAAVDRFAAAMKDKLAIARQKGRGGWETCSAEDLGRMLREHVEKGDPRDVANFCMFLWSLGHGIAPQASVVQQEPLGFISPKQVERIVDPDGEFGAYIPMRKTPAGNFTLAAYTHPAQQAKPQPLLSSEIWNNDAIMEVNADARLPYELIERFVRAVEAAHGITKE